MWLIKGFDDLWVGFPEERGGAVRPAPAYSTPITVFFTCHRSNKFVRFRESTIAAWDAVERFESFDCPHCGETHQTAHGCAYLWVEA